ncbi:hypothetical protein ABZ769_10975 [Streptomyces olivoreticuli]
MALKPTTTVRYRAYVDNDLAPAPALGKIKLDGLGYGHIAAFVRAQLSGHRPPDPRHPVDRAGRGRLTPPARP